MTKLRTSAIVAVSMAIGIVGGAAVTAIADQPNMRSALDHLVAADSFLQRAAENKDGHRVKAIKLVNEAIVEVRLGIKAGK